MNLLYEKASKFSLEETLKKVKEELSKIGFGVLWELNFKSKLKEKGLDYQYDFWVLEVCNPPKALKVLESVQQAGYFLPCKVVVYESDSGIKAGFPKPVQMIGQITDSEVVHKLAKEVEEELISAIEKAL